MVGAAMAVPAMLRFVRRGGWPAVVGHVRRAVAATAVALAGTAGLVAWAHSLSKVDREVASWPYAAAFVVWAIAVAAGLACWTGVAFAIGRRIRLSPRMLRLETVAALVVAGAMAAMTVMAFAWWETVPGSAPGQIGVIVAAMLAADGAAGFGVARIRGVA